MTTVALLLSLIFVAFGLDPNRFKPFLLNNRQVQCAGNGAQPRLPLSYYVPGNYYDSIPNNMRIPPGQNTQPTIVPACKKKLVQPAAMEAYQFQTERYITSGGLNIYDGALWTMAMTLLGEVGQAEAYERTIIKDSKTCQFTQGVRGAAKCEGVIVTGQCKDADETGRCGFCYGDGSNRTMAKDNAWTFRSLSDSWAYAGTVDQRCPELGGQWTWNDYKPILGENAWANLIGPLQVAFRKYGSAQAIPADDLSLQLALAFLPSLQSMFVPSVGAVYYAPKNTLYSPAKDFGFDISLENNMSLLSGLKALRYLLQTKNIYTNYIAQLNQMIDAIENFAKQAYDPSQGFFRQGGTVQRDGSFQWSGGAQSFAVDCQTWTMSTLGARRVNSWFGAGAAERIWNKTKELGGYHYQAFSGKVDGLGFAKNSDDQAYSGEWTAGAVNMLRIFAAELGNPYFNQEADALRQNIEWKLTEDQVINGVKVRGVRYANKRYFIPFGWWANPLSSLASTTWCVFLDMNWNPLHLGGGYTTTY